MQHMFYCTRIVTFVLCEVWNQLQLAFHHNVKYAERTEFLLNVHKVFIQKMAWGVVTQYFIYSNSIYTLTVIISENMEIKDLEADQEQDGATI